MSYNFNAKDLIETYKYLHTIPEPAFEEYKTSEYIFEFLKNIGLNPVRCAKTGIFADIKGCQGNRNLLIRADIDALPIKEESGVDFISKNIGYMHACGHDMHTTCLLFAAKYFADNRDSFCGNIRVVFQPAEEGTGGALPMIEQGVLDDVTAAIALHIDPLENSGTVIYKDGSFTASPDDYKVIIKGKGGHGAEPDDCLNPIIIASQIVKEFSQLKNSFLVDKEYVTSVCTFNSGTFNNIIPEFAEITGTARAFDSKTRYELRDKLKEIAENIVSFYGGEVEFIYNELYPPTINSTEMNNFLIKASQNTDGISAIKRLDKGSMTGDDFSYFAERVPSSYFRFGVGGTENRYPLHNSKLRIDENSLMPACSLLINFAREYLL